MNFYSATVVWHVDNFTIDFTRDEDDDSWEVKRDKDFTLKGAIEWLFISIPLLAAHCVAYGLFVSSRRSTEKSKEKLLWTMTIETKRKFH